LDRFIGFAKCREDSAGLTVQAEACFARKTLSEAEFVFFAAQRFRLYLILWDFAYVDKLDNMNGIRRSGFGVAGSRLGLGRGGRRSVFQPRGHRSRGHESTGAKIGWNCVFYIG
jgi:hypothetical protein